VVIHEEEDQTDQQQKAALSKQITPGTEEEFGKWVAYADRLVRQYVALVAEPASEAALTDLFVSQPVGKVTATFGTSILINFDVKASGESMTHPHLRTVSINEAYVKKMVGAAIAARGGVVAENDVYLIYDAGKHGNERMLMSAFKGDGNKSIPHDPKRLYVCTSEKSLADRRSLTRGFATLDQMEFVYVVTKDGLKVPERKRKLFEGSNHGNTYGPLALKDWDDMWHVSSAKKRKMLGPRRIAVGGPTDGVDVGGADAPREPKKATGNNHEDTFPFNYFEMPDEWYQELLHSMNCEKGVIDLTASSGRFALNCVKKKVPYLGVCYTEDHVLALKSHLKDEVLAAFKDPDDDLFQAGFAKLLKTKKDDKDTEKEKDKDKEKEKEKEKETKKSKKKDSGKKNKKSKSEGSNDSGSADPAKKSKKKSKAKPKAKTKKSAKETESDASSSSPDSDDSE
jgi:hypothetical protein